MNYGIENEKGQLNKKDSDTENRQAISLDE